MNVTTFTMGVSRLVTKKYQKERHIRRIFGSLQDPQFHTPLKVLDLKRIQIGTIKLDITSSRWRFLTPKEEKALIRGTAY
jgi:23S rRNA pseudouridine2605 synthase